MLNKKILILLFALPLFANCQKLARYRYWFDNNFATAQTVSSTDSIINLALNVNNLTIGFHQLNFQSQDTNNLWSSISTSYFYNTNFTDANMSIFKYWFDDDFASANLKYVQIDSTNDFTALLDIESLSPGQHTLNYQFSDRQGKWSSIVSDTITRGSIAQKVFIQPKLFVTKATLKSGEIQLITGRDFTPNGTISLSVKNSAGDFIETNNSFTYLPNGSFSYKLPVDNTMPDGEYQVYATDVATGHSTAFTKFWVNIPPQRSLWINKPSGKDNYLTNELFLIQWGDYIDKSLALGKSGLVQKSYKIEISNNNGATWQVIQDPVVEPNAVPGTYNNDFSLPHSIPLPGTYTIKITDKEKATNYSISAPFTIESSTLNNFSSSLIWDKSFSETEFMASPIGLAADGTSRIFIKLSKNASITKAVSKIKATISPAGNDLSPSTTSLMGKILYAQAVVYNLEANDDKLTLTDTKLFSTPTGASDFYFWLVAPDDFTTDPADQRDERMIRVDFEITYADQSQTQLKTRDIYIVRPPLFLVHGLNGSAGTFANAKYNVDGHERYFNTSILSGFTINNPVWKEALRLNLDNYASFSHNAEIILGKNLPRFDERYPNTFISILSKMHKKRYASTRVDYVAHSMGGCIARSLIIQYPDLYNHPSGESKNYNRGYINKLITINTPHNGSYLADLLFDRYSQNILTNFGAAATGVFLSNGYFHDGTPSDAVKNLQAYHGGVRFPKTVIKNHLIGSDLDKFDNTKETKIIANNKLIATAYGLLMPFFVFDIHMYMFSKYLTSDYLGNSDMVVPISSQLPGKLTQATDLDLFPNEENSASIKYGIENSHTEITHDLVVGTRVMHLLNAGINSLFFADDIAANDNANHRAFDENRVQAATSIADTAINYFDTTSIKISTSFTNNAVFVDSTLHLNLNVKDTLGLQRVRLIFQNNFYDGYSKANNQIFDIKTSSDAIGKNILLAEATYDSLGYTINHVDTISLFVKSLDTLKSFYLSPGSVTLNPQQIWRPILNAVYTTYVGVLNNTIDSLVFKIADTNVVYFDPFRYQFIAKDSGTTHIIFNYKGFIDTAFIYISEPQQALTALPVDLISFNGNIKPAFNLLEWKTGTEINFSHFILERSVDSRNWTKVARINSLQNSSAGINDYSYKDSVISNSVTYYRLQSVDNNGSIKISNTVILRRNTSSKVVTVFPNPVTKNEVFIDFGQSVLFSTVNINVYDVAGKIVKTAAYIHQNTNLFRLDLHGLKPSVYILKIQKGDEMQSVKISVIQ